MKVDITRFSGFASLYSGSRPVPPPEVCRILLAYLRKDRSRLTVDLGSGTGLSTAMWTQHSDHVVGIDPTDDMLAEAKKQFPGIDFRQGSGYQTGLPASSADVVTCSQSFHWMEPFATLEEGSRILAPGGVFAAYDCLWPVSWDWEAEKAYEQLFEEVNAIVAGIPALNTSDVFFPKDRHLDNVRQSGRFRYGTEVLFQNREPCDAQRFAGIALSQGQIQKLIKSQNPQVERLVESFLAVVHRAQAVEMTVSYRMVIGVK